MKVYGWIPKSERKRLRKEKKRNPVRPVRKKKVKPAKKINYVKYLLSEKWKKIRMMVLDRDEHKCFGCEGTSNLHIHHRTYEHLGSEEKYLSDLITLCENCHYALHQPPPSKKRRVK